MTLAQGFAYVTLANGLYVVQHATAEDGKVTDYDYDAALNLVATTVSPGATDQRVQSYSYDPLGRLETTTNFDGSTTTLGYNNRGLVTSRVVMPPGGQGSTALFSATYGYDDLGRLTSEKVGADAVGTTYEYTPSSQIRKVIDPDGVVTTSSYDALYRPYTVTDFRNGVRSFTATNAYDNASNLTARTWQDVDQVNGGVQNLTTTYGYDGLDRLVSITDPASHESHYYYD